MNIAKNIGSWLCIYLAATCFFICANVYALSHVANADNIKQTLDEQGTYRKIVPALMSGMSYNASAASAGQLPIQEPWVQDAATKAFSAKDLEQKGNTVIDSTFEWLDGKTEKPTFSLDFGPNKALFAQEVASYTEQRLNNLPQCELNNVPNSVDPFTATCLPYGVDPRAIAATIQSDITNDQNFLGNPVISSDNLSLDPTNQTKSTASNPFNTADRIGSLYENRGVLLWILPIATIAFATAGIGIAANRKRALGSVARSFLTTGIGLLAFGLFFVFALGKIMELSARDKISQEIIAPLVIAVAKEAQIVYLTFAAIAIITAIALFIARRKIFQKNGGETGIRTLGTR